MTQVTTVFQTTRTQKMLGGMAPPPTPIFVFRCHKWTLVSTKDLLPGDLISLAFKKRQNQNAVAVQQQQQQQQSAAAAASDKSGKNSGKPAVVDAEDTNEASGGPAGGGSSSDTTLPTHSRPSHSVIDTLPYPPDHITHTPSIPFTHLSLPCSSFSPALLLFLLFFSSIVFSSFSSFSLPPAPFFSSFSQVGVAPAAPPAATRSPATV